MLLMCCLVAGILPMPALAEEGTGPFTDGVGSAESPYQIATAGQLAALAAAVNGGTDYSGTHFKLANDIDLSAVCGADIDGKEVSWTPIGSKDSPFAGNFDGGGYAVKNLYINAQIDGRDLAYVGLFGHLTGNGVISRLGVDGSVTVNGFNIYVGGVCGLISSGTITSCYNTCAVSITGSTYGTVGGICGENHGSDTIKGCYNTGTVSDTANDIAYCGGICGANTNGTIEDCYNTGAVSAAAAKAGGASVGGVCGINGVCSKEIRNSYNTGAVTGSGGAVGGVCGSRCGGSITQCYYLEGTTADSNSAKLTAEQFSDADSFTGLDFETSGDDGVWQMDSILGRPVLQAIPEPYFEGSGSEADPYRIPNLAKLELFRDSVNAGNHYTGQHFKLTADIDMSKKYITGTRTSWTPIGDNGPIGFAGIFDGGGHVVSELYINVSDHNGNNKGLFGFLTGTIKNLGVAGCDVTGGHYVGGICGQNNKGTITNCYIVSGKVTGTTNSIGGICGINGGGGTISNCYSTCAVSGPSYVGAVCGTEAPTGSTIRNCYYPNICGAGGAGTSKTGSQFASGEVAWLLQGEQTAQVWGQTAGGGYPELTGESAKKVCKVAFMDGETEYAAAYANPGGHVTLPAAPKQDGYTFVRWEDKTGAEFTAGTAVLGDMVVTAKWAEDGSTPAPTPTPGGSSYDYYTITATAGDGGSITPGGSVRVRERRDTTFVITPDEGYEIADVLIDGKSAGLLSEYTFEKVRKSHTIEASFRKTGNASYTVCPRDATCPVARFSDCSPAAWYHNGVHYCVESGLMVGVSETSFAPDMSASRAMIATILWRQAGSPVVNYLMQYEDVEQGAWYAEAVRWATSVGVVAGYSSTSFGPADPITREQFATMLYRFEQLQGGGFSGDWVFLADLTEMVDFSDYNQISAWARESMCWTVMEGIIQGKEGSVLDPKGTTTRAEVAAMLMRYCKLIAAE